MDINDVLAVLRKLYDFIPYEYRTYFWIALVGLTLLSKFKSLFKSGKTYKIVPKYRFSYMNTYFPQNANRWNKRYLFEKELAENVGWFVYVKFDENGKPMVVGKSGSSRVNSRSDVSFDLNNANGPARRELNRRRLNWDQTKIAVRGVRTERQAYKLERKILNRFKIYGS